MSCFGQLTQGDVIEITASGRVGRNLLHAWAGVACRGRPASLES